MKTVLVVDDEEAVVEFVGSLLEDAGYRVLRAFDGRTALEISRARQPDVVLTDIMMPIMNGIELCQELRADPETRGIRIILMTAGRLSDCQCPGAEFLAKPFDLATLEEIVAKASAAGGEPPTPDRCPTGGSQ